jgi:xanthosine utilization system XapX-like protein
MLGTVGMVVGILLLTYSPRIVDLCSLWVECAKRDVFSEVRGECLSYDDVARREEASEGQARAERWPEAA